MSQKHHTTWSSDRLVPDGLSRVDSPGTFEIYGSAGAGRHLEKLVAVIDLGDFHLELFLEDDVLNFFHALKVSGVQHPALPRQRIKRTKVSKVHDYTWLWIADLQNLRSYKGVDRRAGSYGNSCLDGRI